MNERIILTVVPYNREGNAKVMNTCYYIPGMQKEIYYIHIQTNREKNSAILSIQFKCGLIILILLLLFLLSLSMKECEI